MATVRAIGTQALIELGVISPGVAMPAGLSDTVLNRAQGMIDAWAANRLTLSLQLRTVFTMPSGDSSIQVGTGQAVNIVRPMWINTINYLIPGSSPAVEVPIGQMDEDAYAALSIKALQSALPLQSFYQTNLSDAFGTLFLWPQVTQDVEIALYTPQAIGVPATLDTDLIGPPGYRDAFMYGLAERLVTPLAVETADVPMLARLAARAWDSMTRPNITPGVLGIDAALVPHSGAGYNILSDVTQTSR
jgi:hypothetical protein